MNKLVSRVFLPVKEEVQKYKNKDGEAKASSSLRKRWYATMECAVCLKEFTIREQSNDVHLVKPCEGCAKRVLAYRSFLRKSGAKHKDRFDYSLVTVDNYVNLFTPVNIVCRRHGVFTQAPKDHTSKLNGKLCCPSCIAEFNKSHNKRSIQSWKEELSVKAPHINMEKHGNSYSNRERCTLACEHHGTFTAALAEIKKSKHICPLCAQDANSWGGRFRRTDVSGILYLIALPELGLWKLGVTSMSTNLRLRSLKETYTIIWEERFDTLAQAYQKETELLRRYKNFRRDRTLPKILGKCKGNTELLTCCIPNTAIHESNFMSKEP